MKCCHSLTFVCLVSFQLTDEAVRGASQTRSIISAFQRESSMAQGFTRGSFMRMVQRFFL